MLCLTFVDTVASSQQSSASAAAAAAAAAATTAPLHEEDMIPGGADVPVTDVNKHQ